jgi:hypothetical protein
MPLLALALKYPTALWQGHDTHSPLLMRYHMKLQAWQTMAPHSPARYEE